MFCVEKRPPAPKVTNSKPLLRLLGGGACVSKRIACSMSRLTDVPDSEARFFSFARSRSSRVIVVRVMYDHTAQASRHQRTRVARRNEKGVAHRGWFRDRSRTCCGRAPAPESDLRERHP